MAMTLIIGDLPIGLTRTGLLSAIRHVARCSTRATYGVARRGLNLACFVRELWLFGLAFRPARLSHHPRTRFGDGARVLVIPGLMADDRTMLPLRLALRARGYRAYGWKMGSNTGATADVLDRVDARVRHIQRHDGKPIVLLGWSLGGLIAREYAKLAPDRVAAVITLASPFSGDIGATWIARVYEWVAGHSVAKVPIEYTLHEKPPVPTAAIWSRSDGIIPAAAARGGTGEADFTLEIACAHMTFPTADAAHQAMFEAIALCRAMAQPGRTVGHQPSRPIAQDRPRAPAPHGATGALATGQG